MKRPIIIANYLPQFHPTIENNKWWGEGFTEWTNVAKAKQLYPGHYQPKIPADLGFYDLRNADSREEQAKLAKEAGISAFCYWHYWLGNERRLLEKPLDEVVRLGEPDFPFCLGWANHDWQRKDWSSDASIFIKETLIEQKYGGKDDYIKHFNKMLPAFKDKRYFKIENRLVFKIFRPDSILNVKEFFETWNKLAIQNNLPKFYFIACTVDKTMTDKYISDGYDLVNLSMLNYPFKVNYSKLNIIKRMFIAKVLRQTKHISYSKAIEIFNDDENSNESIAPTIIPNWDHTPRSGVFGNVLHNSNPKLFKKHVNQIFKSIKKKENKIVFLKSWNEWGEGNYMEPDLKYGKKYIETLAECLKKF